ncbi:MAG: SUMF1/EgtB/PvdO family nonheme iron enzyme [Myxococcota bacterium]
MTRWAPLLVVVVGISCATSKGGGGSAPSSLRSTSNMVKLPGTTFKMGSDQGEPDETPEHEVTVKTFLLDRTEITNAEYEQCVDAGVCGPARSLKEAGLSAPRQPVVGMSWNDADKYCKWVGKRLPTEAEFERAVRGAQGRLYPFDGKPDPSKGNLRGTGDGHELTAPVGSFPSGVSKEGPLLDLMGNAAEWMNDWYDPNWYVTNKEWTDPKGPARSEEKVVRGGSYRDPEYAARGSSRNRLEFNQASDTVGFRCAADG